MNLYNMSRIGKSRDAESKMMVALDMGEVVWKWGMTANGHGVSFRGDEYDLTLCTTL